MSRAKGRALWLPDVLRDAGCKVRTLDGWAGRGKELVSVQGLVWHHTVTPPSMADDRVADLLRVGHAKLPGPLSQLGLQRDGTFVVVADGRCNHNGYGQWGNASIGIEAYNSGTGELWPQAQLDAYDLGSAAILRHLGYGVDRMKGHKETDPDRKIDPNGIDMAAARQRVARLITDPTPEPPKGWLHMLSDKEQTELLDKVREIHRETVDSIPPSKDGKVKASGRWLIGDTWNRMERVLDRLPGKG